MVASGKLSQLITLLLVYLRSFLESILVAALPVCRAGGLPLHGSTYIWLPSTASPHVHTDTVPWPRQRCHAKVFRGLFSATRGLWSKYHPTLGNLSHLRSGSTEPPLYCPSTLPWRMCRDLVPETHPPWCQGYKRATDKNIIHPREAPHSLGESP